MPKSPQVTEITKMAMPFAVFPLVSKRMPQTTPTAPKAGGRISKEAKPQIYPAAINPPCPLELFEVVGHPHLGHLLATSDT